MAHRHVHVRNADAPQAAKKDMSERAYFQDKKGNGDAEEADNKRHRVGEVSIEILLAQGNICDGPCVGDKDNEREEEANDPPRVQDQILCAKQVR